MIYTTRLLYLREIADRTMMVRVERPEGFRFGAGQYADLSIPDPPENDGLGTLRSLSIASAPSTEPLEFIYRHRNSAFKRVLRTLPVGADLLIEGPFDDLEYEAQDGRDLVFIAGGVGVAPFLSIVREAAATGSRLPATLFYSNRRPEDAACLDELQRIARSLEGFRVIPTMTRVGRSALDWKGETGRIDAELLERYLESLQGPMYYVAGSAFFIMGIRAALAERGVSSADIGLEMYSGY